jgi:hypothetical protein
MVRVRWGTETDGLFAMLFYEITGLAAKRVVKIKQVLSGNGA